MRRTMLVGAVLTAAAVLVVVVSAAFDLELEPVAVLGLALGAVLALVPDRTPLLRLAGFTGGFVAAWITYLLRAGVLPDSVTARSLAVLVVVGGCAALAIVTAGRVPLWAALVGAAAMVGAYEQIYAAAPPEVTSTSVSAATAVLMTVAIGFLAVALAQLAGESTDGDARVSRRRSSGADDTARLDEMMEKSK